MTSPAQGSQSLPATRSGWAWPGAAKKAHYFDDSAISLCGKWMYTGPLTANQGDSSPDDCVACTRLLVKMEEK